jgi:hypothetical protein
MLQDQVCPRCGRRLHYDTPRGLCPACLLLAVLREESDHADSELGSASLATTSAPVPGKESARPKGDGLTLPAVEP